MTGRIGIITGLAFEAALVSKLSKRMNWLQDAPAVRCVGMGGAGASAAVNELVQLNVVGLVSFGIAGGLAPSLETGTLLVPESVVTGADQTYPVAPQWQAALLSRLAGEFNTSGGPLISGAQLVSTAAQKQAAWRSSGAVAADMESAEIAAAAQTAGLPFLVVRAIADNAAVELPPAAAAMSPDGKLAIGTLLTSLARNPGQIPALIGLGLKTRRACAVLEKTLELSGPSLKWSEVAARE